MRVFVGLAAAGLLVACNASTTPATAARTCTAYSPANVIEVGVTDNRRSLTVPLCDAIAVELAGRPSSPWPDIQSSDKAILAIVALPLAAPPSGGVSAVYLGQRTGTATLLSTRPDVKCANPVGVCPIVHWW